MARIAAVLMPGGALAPVSHWVLYHAFLFGFESLHLLDHGNADPEVMTRLEDYAALGATVHRRTGTVDAPPDPTAVLANLIETFKSQSRYDLVLPLTSAEFVLVNGPEAINASRTHVLAEIARIAGTDTPARTAWGFESLPSSRHLFRYVAMRHCVMQVASFAGFDAATGTTDTLAGVPSNGYGCTSLQVARLNQAHAGDLVRGNMEPLIALSALSRTLEVLAGPLTLPAETNSASLAAPTAPLVIDLDRCTFANAPYLAAHPDVAQSSLDPLQHFIEHGYMEGRTIHTTPETAREVFDRMSMLRDWRSDGTVGYANLASIALQIGRLTETDQIIAEALLRFGPTPALLREHALCATHGATDAKSAAQRWSRYLADAPAAGPSDYLLGAQAQREALRLEAALALVRKGLATCPEYHALARLAVELDRRAIPMAHAGIGSLAEAHALMLQFASIGQGSEFGLVQRSFQAEPDDLLRFTHISLPALTRALREGFSGFADPADLYLDTAFHDTGEHYLRSRAYGSAMHTFKFERPADTNTFLAQLTRRSAFLRDKLLDELESGARIFVYREAFTVARSAVEAFLTAFREISSAPLLYVRTSETPARPGPIVKQSPGIMLASLPPPPVMDDMSWVDLQGWLQICMAAQKHLHRTGFPYAPSSTHPGNGQPTSM